MVKQKKNREDDYHSLIGRRIEYFRKKRKLHSDDVSRAAEISPELLSDIENGKKTVTVFQLERIAGFLGMPIEDFLPTKPVAPFTEIVGYSRDEAEAGLKKTKEAIKKVKDKQFSSSLIKALEKVGSA